MTQYQKASLTQEMINSIKEQIKELFFKRYNKEMISHDPFNVSKIEKFEFDSGKIFISKKSVLITCNAFCKLVEGSSNNSEKLRLINKDKIELIYDSIADCYKILNPPKFESLN